MIKETIYVAINQKDEIQWVRGSSKKTRYFKTDRYLKGAVEYHNKYHPDDIWKIRKCVILEDEPQTDIEIARAIVHKAIDDAVIAEDAYPDLRQKMHDAVDNYEPQTERNE